MPGAVYRNQNQRKARSPLAAEPRSNTRATRSRQPEARPLPEPEKKVVPEAPRPREKVAPPRLNNSEERQASREKVSPPRFADSEERQAREKADITPSSPRAAWMVRLTPSILIMLGMLLMVTLTFFFGFGIIVGRGMIPPNQPAQLESLLPEHTPQEMDSPEHILPEEELHFMANLRAEGMDASTLLPTEGETAVTQAVPPPPGVSPATQTGTGSTYVTQPGTPVADLTRYDFVLQVATLRQEDQADKLRLALEDDGFRTKLEREKVQNGTLYKVQILYRGKRQDFQALQDSLPDYGIKDSFLVSRTPAP